MPKSPGRHVALLRGINVGGNNLIKMAELRACFEALGFTEVATLIASGNVVFAASAASKAKLVTVIEKALDDAFGYASRVVIVSAGEMAEVVAQAPPGFGKQPDKYRYDVLFVKEPATPAEVLKETTTRPGVDTAHVGDHAVYYRRLVARAAETHLAKLIQRPIYKSLTIRNWNTTTKLLDLCSR